MSPPNTINIQNHPTHHRAMQLNRGHKLYLIFNMDETAIWFDMIPEYTLDIKGARRVYIRSSGSEKMKVSVILCSSADGYLLIPLLIFKVPSGGERAIVDLRAEIEAAGLSSKVRK